MKRLLIVGGTGDAERLLDRAIYLPDLQIITTLAGRTRQPKAIAGVVRVGGFGGEAGLVEYLRTENIDLIIDATHPFAAQMSWNVAGAAARVGIPRLHFLRPAWTRSPEDNWIEVASINDAVAAIPDEVERIFLTIGRQQLAAFANLKDKWCLMRSIDPPDPQLSLPLSKLILDRGPFNLAKERQLLLDNNIQAIVSKNSGGNATYAKIIAARELKIPVIMVQRPRIPDGEIVTDIKGAIEWIVDRTAQIQPQFGDVILGNYHPTNRPQPTDVILGDRPIPIEQERQIYALLTDTVRQLKQEIFGTVTIPPNADERIFTIDREDIDLYVRQHGLPAAALAATRDRTQGIWLTTEDDRFCVGYWERGIITDKQCFDTYTRAEAAFIDLAIEISGVNLPQLRSSPDPRSI